MAKLETDQNGIVTTTGRFQGRHIDEVMNYLEGLEQAVMNNDSPPPAAPTGEKKEDGKKEPTPAEKLAAAASNRIDPMQAMTWQRLEQDDEEQFSNTVTDYATYKEKIDRVKATLHPVQRAQKGLHRTIYINVKSEDPKVRARIFKPVEADQQNDDQHEEPPPADEGKKEEKKPTPKAAPPMSGGTPRREAPKEEKNRKPKLIATEKIREFCRRTGQPLDAYLMRLEDSGTTQEMLDNAGQMGRRDTPRSVYDRTRATSR